MVRKIHLLSAAAVLGVVACSVKEASNTADTSAAATTPVASTSAAPNVVSITASEYKFDMPDQIPAGLTTFKLTDAGKELHHATLIKLDSGKTAADFANGMKNMKPGTPPPGWMIPSGGPNAAAPGGSSELTMVIQPGNYAVVCFIPDSKGVPHAAHGMVKALTVTPNADANTAEPSADITVTLKDYQFDFSTPLTAGRHTIKLVTAPGQPHEFTFFKLAPGKSAKDLTSYVETGMKGPPPAQPLGGVSAMSAGDAAYYTVDLTAGDYAIVCFLEDARDGKPHFMHGMVQQIKVT